MTQYSQCSAARVAVIDIGSNTIRLLIGRVTDGKLDRMKSIRQVSRLARDIASKGSLNKDSVDISIRTLVNIKAICESYAVDQIIAIGTSALREAVDTGAFLKLVKEKTGIDVNVISGDTEADLTIKGIRLGSAVASNSACSIIVDIGGGSTELILDFDTNVKYSLPIGAVTLLELCIKNDPPSDYELSLLADTILTKLKPSISIIRNSIDRRRCDLIATGGTPTTLGAIHLKMDAYDGGKVHGLHLPYSDITKIYEKMISVPLTDRRSIVGLESSRADIMIPGTMIMMSIMDLLEVRETVISDYGLMEGLLYDTICSA